MPQIVPVQFLPASSLPTSSSFDTIPTPGGTRSDGPYTTGFSFTVSSTVTVSRLGRLWESGNTSNRLIRLWNASGPTLLASGTILNASASDADGFKWIDVTAVDLVSGQTYVIGVNEFSGEGWKDEWTPTLDGRFSVIETRYETGSAYPGIAASASKIFSTPSMTFSAAVTGAVVGRVPVVVAGVTRYLPLYDSVG